MVRVRWVSTRSAPDQFLALNSKYITFSIIKNSGRVRWGKKLLRYLSKLSNLNFQRVSLFKVKNLVHIHRPFITQWVKKVVSQLSCFASLFVSKNQIDPFMNIFWNVFTFNGLTEFLYKICWSLRPFGQLHIVDWGPTVPDAKVNASQVLQEITLQWINASMLFYSCQYNKILMYLMEGYIMQGERLLNALRRDHYGKDE